MNTYKFYLGGILLPVPPPKVEIRYANKFRRVDLADGREFAFTGGKGLAEVRFTALLPQKQYPFADYRDGKFKAGEKLLRELTALKDSAFRFVDLTSCCLSLYS